MIYETCTLINSTSNAEKCRLIAMCDANLDRLTKGQPINPCAIVPSSCLMERTTDWFWCKNGSCAMEFGYYLENDNNRYLLSQMGLY